MSDHETSKDLESTQESQEPIRSTYKRRSSVFQHVTRRVEGCILAKRNLSSEPEETIDIDDDTEAVIEAEPTKPIESDVATEDEDFDLPAYIEELKNERQLWKETLKARKARRRNLQKQKAIVQKHGADYDLSLLSESERSFLQERPDYVRICRNITKLSEAAVKIATLSQEIQVLNNRLALKMERKVRSGTKKIIGMSQT